MVRGGTRGERSVYEIPVDCPICKKKWTNRYLCMVTLVWIFKSAYIINGNTLSTVAGDAGFAPMFHAWPGASLIVTQVC